MQQCRQGCLQEACAWDCPWHSSPAVQPDPCVSHVHSCCTVNLCGRCSVPPAGWHVLVTAAGGQQEMRPQRQWVYHACMLAHSPHCHLQHMPCMSCVCTTGAASLCVHNTTPQHMYTLHQWSMCACAWGCPAGSIAGAACSVSGYHPLRMLFGGVAI
jgi:hypothetical protein